MELSTPLHFTTLNFRDLCPEVCLEMHEEESNLGQVHDSSFLQPHHYQTNIVVQLSCNYHWQYTSNVHCSVLNMENKGQQWF